MLNIFSHQRNVNQNCNEILSQGYYRTNAGKNVGKEKFLHAADKNADTMENSMVLSQKTKD